MLILCVSLFSLFNRWPQHISRRMHQRSRRAPRRQSVPRAVAPAASSPPPRQIRASPAAPRSIKITHQPSVAVRMNTGTLMNAVQRTSLRSHHQPRPPRPHSPRALRPRSRQQSRRLRGSAGSTRGASFSSVTVRRTGKTLWRVHRSIGRARLITPLIRTRSAPRKNSTSTPPYNTPIMKVSFPSAKPRATKRPHAGDLRSICTKANATSRRHVRWVPRRKPRKKGGRQYGSRSRSILSSLSSPCRIPKKTCSITLATKQSQIAAKRRARAANRAITASYVRTAPGPNRRR